MRRIYAVRCALNTRSVARAHQPNVMLDSPPVPPGSLSEAKKEEQKPENNVSFASHGRGSRAHHPSIGLFGFWRVQSAIMLLQSIHHRRARARARARTLT